MLFSICAIAGVQFNAASPKPPVVPDQSEVPPRSAYAGQAVCAQCHAKEADTYAKTVHALDSGLPTEKNMIGDFTVKGAVMRTSNPKLAFLMTSAPGGFYQSAVDLSDLQNPKADSRRMDIVIGSGRHGQSYLMWQGDQLYEMPVSYWTYDHRWVNSPGYPDGEVRWDRPVGPRCLECHASYFGWLPPKPNRYDKDSLVLGIDCERCHGPGAAHVAFEQSKTPHTKGSKDLAIVNPAHLSRDQQMSLCALCHSGAADPIRTPLTFKVGDDIHDFLKIKPLPMGATVDVHGNQVGALQQSKCYASGKMTCSTCHNVHMVQQDADAFSSRCLTCHQVKSCPKFRTMGKSIQTKCVACHMPVGKSKAITATESGDTMQATMRNHRIAIYPDATAEETPAAPGR